MTSWTLIQIVFNIFLAVGLFVVMMRMSRAPKNDPRLSRGLQLLQSKIAVLEDLSDRTETQVQQLTAILEQKAREVQAKVQLAEQHVQEIRVSMERSLEVAKIFQDKIPHKEIIERQNTIKYVQAARLAHRGVSAEEIAKEIDLPRGEVEFIASVNRDRLMFAEDELPEWAKEEAAKATPLAQPETSTDQQREANAQRLRAEIELAEQQRLVESLSRLQFEMQNLDMELARENAGRDLAAAFEVPRVETDSLKRIGEEFRRAIAEGEANDAKPQFLPVDQISALIPQVMDAAETMIDAGGSLGDLAKHAVKTAAQSQTAARARAAATSIAERVSQEMNRNVNPLAAKPEISSELKAARELAREVSGARPTHIVSSRGSSTQESVIKKVRFPKLDETEME